MPPHESRSLVASTEGWDSLERDALAAGAAERRRLANLLARAPAAAHEGLGRHLVLAADQFIITPASRMEELSQAKACGHDLRTVIAGYHWFTDWGRDTMISLEGLTLCTGRYDEAKAILLTFARYVKDGLIPNLFPEGRRSALYHTADATLWYFHALDRYEQATHDRETLRNSIRFPRYSAASCEGHAFRDRRGSAGWSAKGGRRGLSIDVDGCEGRWLGGDATARQARGDTGALV